ncbi:hypothetical protein HanPSC8_Chr04g0177811 [Helianthus annuus]|nr:hypothetical protein HanIR_Chr04g0198361 [Helianthus annuus]KAJ0932798.1 hypothetical protein HanPSC8_Chr04g0177811 [Helianthus annuus]
MDGRCRLWTYATSAALVDSLHTHLRASRTMLYLKLGEVDIRGDLL